MYIVSIYDYLRFVSVKGNITLLWLRQDLRWQDNSALAAAIAAGDPILPVYIDDRAAAGDWAPGAASRWFLHHALAAWEQSLATLGGRLCYLQGDSMLELPALAAATGAVRVYWNRRYEGPLREQDAAIKKALRASGIEVNSYNSRLLHEPHTVSTDGGQAYKVYTPYWRKVKDRRLEPPVRIDLAAAQFVKGATPGLSLEALGLLPEHAWHHKLAAHWTVSEAAA